MRRVLILCEAYGGGVKTYIDSIHEYYLKSKKNYSLNVVVSSERDKDYHDKYEVWDFLSFQSKPWLLFKSITKLKKYSEANDIDMIHGNSTITGVLLVIFNYIYKIDYIYTPHGYYSLKVNNKFRKSLILWIEKMINHKATKVIHVSGSEAEYAKQNGICNESKSVVINNGVKDLNVEMKAGNKKINIVNLARVDEQKNPELFIRIAELIIAKYPDVSFIWGGKGIYFEEFFEKTCNNDDIKFLGFVDSHDFLNEGDIYLSTSIYEGLPFSVVEAMMHKMPIVLSDVIGHKDLVKGNGYLFDINDISEATDYIEILIQNRKKREKMSKKSYEIFKNEYSLEVMINQIEKIYVTGECR